MTAPDKSKTYTTLLEYFYNKYMSGLEDNQFADIIIKTLSDPDLDIEAKRELFWNVVKSSKVIIQKSINEIVMHTQDESAPST